MTADLLARTPMGYRARQLGHDLVVVHTGNRFRVECSCGWKTSANMTRKTTFARVGEHVQQVIASDDTDVSARHVYES